MADSTVTLLGMAVVMPCGGLGLVGPASMALMMAVSGAGAATTRGAGVELVGSS